MTSAAELPDFPGLGVTGSTGGLGGMVARELAALGSTQRLLVRDPARAPELDGATPAVCSYTDTAAARQALDGVKVLFMVSAAETQDRVQQHTAFIDAAAGAGVQHVVYTSFYGAAPDATFTLARDHYATEEHIRASGMDFTFLRDNLYLDFLPLLAGEDGVIRGPAGDGAFSGVAREDVARCAVAVLRDPAIHKGAIYNLTGPEELTLAQAADIITQSTGRTVSYQPETLEEAYASRASYGAPPWQVDAWVSTYTAIAAGDMAGISPDVHGLTGEDPISLREFLARPVL
ncbi:SDR family oxidoreductase [Arthrobacter sp. KFRI-F3372]|uniref:SDR family oxidoreductase n=1 Tax=Pseudarthrobacter TaxID=1742993 RepID=UPI00203C3C1C|nr:SDR family oxidoreductase [Pseudarthrobacter sp. NCCP-2145]WHP59211.1 SDR family oxidoreductase [Arthrobacter sp. KFRI-F3372]BFE43886.1 SDR family oxidoreductase [Pseudarthrobacter oxydans]GKV74198.1 NAD(P)-dependent oxidoreductase [Pseudarthrobacter sp. NCCP-2145]